MMWRSRPLLLVASFLLCSRVQGGPPKVYVNQKDRQVGVDATAAVEKFCADVQPITDSDKVDGEASLEEVLNGPNFILEAANESKNNDDFGQKLTESFPEKIKGQVLPFFLTAVSLLMLVCFCYTACPCCKCIRCYKGHHRSPFCLKMIFIAPILFVLLVILVSTRMSGDGAKTMLEGFDNIACESAELIETALHGKGTFIGLLPALTNLQNMDNALVSNSPLVVDARKYSTDAQDLSVAVFNARTLLQAMSEFINKTEDAFSMTRQPDLHRVATVGDAGDVHRQCQICTELRSKVSSVTDAFNASLAASTAGFRDIVHAAFTQTGLEAQQKVIRASGDGMVKMKNILVDKVGVFTRPGENPLDRLKGFPIAVIALFLGAYLSLLCACCGASCLVVREKARSDAYSTAPHRFAGVSWTCALLVVMPCLILGGILEGLSLPLAAVCFIADDLNGQMLTDMAPAFGLNMSSTDGVTNRNLVEYCVNPKNKSTDANVLDLMMVKDDNGDMVSWRENSLTGDAVAMKNAVARVRAAGDNTAMATDSAVVQLKSYIRDHPVAAGITPRDTIGTWLTRHSQDGLSSLGCNDVTLNGTTIAGVSAFVAVCDAQCNSTASGDTLCGNTLKTYSEDLLCNEANKSSETESRCAGQIAICSQANSYLASVKYLHTDASFFSCPVFKRGGAACSPSEVCTSYTMQACSFDQWKQDYSDFKDRINTMMVAVDTELDNHQSTIDDDLIRIVALVESKLVTPQDEISSGATCGFVAPAWQGVVDGLCYQSVFGMRSIGKGYVLASKFLIMFAIWMYMVWRFTIDNVNQPMMYGQQEISGQKMDNEQVSAIYA